MMKVKELILLGTGTCSISTRRSMSGIALVDQDNCFLVDCGCGTIRRLVEYGISVHRIKGIAFSHMHTDHMADLAPLIFSQLFDPLGPGASELTLFGPHGLAQSFDWLNKAHGGNLKNENSRLKIVEFKENENFFSGKFGSCDLTALAVNHGHLPAVGYRMDFDGFSIAYSGDSGPCDALIDLAKDADLFICECSVPDDAELPNHLTPSQAGEIAQRANCRKLVLTHFYPFMEDINVIELAGHNFSGEAVRGEDGMRFYFE